MFYHDEKTYSFTTEEQGNSSEPGSRPNCFFRSKGYRNHDLFGRDIDIAEKIELLVEIILIS